jgi:hypothetical protein
MKVQSRHKCTFKSQTYTQPVRIETHFRSLGVYGFRVRMPEREYHKIPVNDYSSKDLAVRSYYFSMDRPRQRIDGRQRSLTQELNNQWHP